MGYDCHECHVHNGRALRIFKIFIKLLKFDHIRNSVVIWKFSQNVVNLSNTNWIDPSSELNQALIRDFCVIFCPLLFLYAFYIEIFGGILSFAECREKSTCNEVKLPLLWISNQIIPSTPIQETQSFQYYLKFFLNIWQSKL
jgi:hypothetical protein